MLSGDEVIMEKILILYASQTGMTMGIATDLHGLLMQELPNYQFDLVNVRDIEPAALADYRLIIFGGSTWDHGISSPDGEEFLARLTDDRPDLSHCHFALLGIGDSAYPEFCGALPLMEADIKFCNGNVDPDFFTIDGFADKEVMSNLTVWAKNFLNKYHTNS